MAYIGPEPAESFTSFATQEFSTSATTSYTLDHAVANENEIALFVNNVRQQPGSGKAYTATGTALTLSAATASTDTMYCVFLGRALQTVTPATNSITAAMVGNDLISGKDALTSAPASTDELLISDAGTLKRIDASLLGGTSIVNTWYLTSDLNPVPTTNSNVLITAFTEYTSAPYAKVGSSMSNSSGIWTFPETGIYKISSTLQFEEYGNAYSGKNGIIIEATTDNSSYSTADVKYSWLDGSAGGACHGFVDLDLIIDVTSTSNVKVKFFYLSQANTILNGGSANSSKITFEKIGNT